MDAILKWGLRNVGKIRGDATKTEERESKGIKRRSGRKKFRTEMTQECCKQATYDLTGVKAVYMLGFQVQKPQN